MDTLWLLFLCLVCAFRDASAAECSRVCGGKLRKFNECGHIPLINGTYSATFIGDTSKTTNEYSTNGGYCDLGSLANDWTLSFKPEAAALFTFSTSGSTFDTTLTVVDCVLGEIERCDDDSGDGTASMLQVRLEQDREYAIVVDGFNRAARGPFILQMSSVFWPPEDECPGVDRLVELPSAAETSVVKLFSGTTAGTDHYLNLTDCLAEEANVSHALVDYGIRTPTDVLGVQITMPGEYHFLVCGSAQSFPIPTVVRPWVCKNDSEPGVCHQPASTVNLSLGDYVSFAVTQSNLTSQLGISYNVYGSINQSPSPWCSKCLLSLGETDSGQAELPISQTFRMRNTTHPITNTSFLGEVFFYHFSTDAEPFFSVCGPLNGRIVLRDCYGNLEFDGQVGTYYQLEGLRRDELYTVEITALTNRDQGVYRIQNVRDAFCDQENFGAGFDERLSLCVDGEVAVLGFVLGILIILSALSIGIAWWFGNLREYARSSAFTLLFLCFLGAIPTMYFLIGCYVEPAPAMRDFLVFWITWSAVCTIVLLYQIAAQDWAVVFGEALFYRDDEDAVKARLLLGVFGLCCSFSFTISGFVLLGTMDGLTSEFTFCAVENSTCDGLQFGAVVQKVIAVHTLALDPNNTVLAENWDQEVTYESVTVRDPSLASSIICAAQPGVQLPTETSGICYNTCEFANGTMMTNNGICEDTQTDCLLGNDCADCGVRWFNATRRIVRCNKSNTIADFWGASDIFVGAVLLPFIYSMIGIIVIFLLTGYASSKVAKRTSSPSFSSEEDLSGDEEEDGDEDPRRPEEQPEEHPNAQHAVVVPLDDDPDVV